MKPMTRSELFMATAAGEYSGELPEPVTRLEYYLKKIKEAVENGSPVAPEDIDTAIEAYLNSHDADIVTEQELSDALAGYYDKSAVDTALSGKADATATQTALNAKQNALTAGAGISISNGEISNTAPNVKPDWNAASGTGAEILNKPTIPTVMTGATAISYGSAGLVPQSAIGDRLKFLRGDGTWANPEFSGMQFDDLLISGTLVPNHWISSGYTVTNDHKFVEVYYKQTPDVTEEVNGETVITEVGGVGVAKGIVENCSTVYPIQLMRWEYDSTNAELSLECAKLTINNGVFSVSNGSFQIVHVIAYK